MDPGSEAPTVEIITVRERAVRWASLAVILLGTLLVATETYPGSQSVRAAWARLQAGVLAETTPPAGFLAARSACAARNESLPPWPPAQPPASVPAFFLPLGHEPVPIDVAGLRSVGEVKRAAVREIALAEKLGRTVTFADVRLFVISREAGLRLVSNNSRVLPDVEKGVPLGALDSFEAGELCGGSCFLLELSEDVIAARSTPRSSPSVAPNIEGSIVATLSPRCSPSIAPSIGVSTGVSIPSSPTRHFPSYCNTSVPPPHRDIVLSLSRLVGGIPTHVDACAVFNQLNISLLYILGDSMAANHAIDARLVVLNDPDTPSKDDCWYARHGVHMEEGDCREGRACQGKLRVFYRFMPIASTSALAEVAQDLSSKTERAVVHIWYGLWYLLNNDEPFSDATARLVADAETLFRSLRTQTNIVSLSVIGPVYPWCERKFRGDHCPRQGPGNMSIINALMRSTTAHAFLPYFDVFNLTRNAGLDGYEDDGTHTTTPVNSLIFELMMQYLAACEPV